jgi:hypothetical protein
MEKLPSTDHRDWPAKTTGSAAAKRVQPAADWLRDEAHALRWLADHDLAELVDERDQLRRALQSVRILAATRIVSKKPTEPEHWQGVLRICREVGVVGSVLRGETDG